MDCGIVKAIVIAIVKAIGGRQTLFNGLLTQMHNKENTSDTVFFALEWTQNDLKHILKHLYGEGYDMSKKKTQKFVKALKKSQK